MNVQEKYQLWCEDPYFGDDTREQLCSLTEDEVEDRFYKDLEFGTGGLRGKLGMGTNRMNRFTVRKATQGLADVICRSLGQERGVAIAYDSRHFSPEFAKEAALCLAANGIKTYLFDSLRPTPELSYAVRALGCMAGIVITASHNPAVYNGYKVYWEDGAQITAPKDREIMDAILAITDYRQVKTMEEKAAAEQNLLQMIGQEIDDSYMQELKKLVLHPECIEACSKQLKIVYTPLHGTGNLPVQRILSELGFEQVYVVPEQEMPDGDFSTVASPNPEDGKAFQLALELAQKVDADLVLATDPDADRLGVYAKNHKSGQYEAFTGNMSGILIGEYETSERAKLGRLPEHGAWVRTIVTSRMSDEITKEYGLDLIEVLTGFKYIGEQMKWMEEKGSQEYVFGYEESYGCLVGTHARDKDAVVAVMALCELAAFCCCEGKNLWDRMEMLYQKYGYFRETLYTLTLEGVDGAQKIASMMQKLRNNPPKTIANQSVLWIRDYKKQEIVNTETKEVKKTTLPVSDVLYFDLSDGSWICVRPSGTEPKIKFYAGIIGTNAKEAEQNLQNMEQALKELCI